MPAARVREIFCTRAADRAAVGGRSTLVVRTHMTEFPSSSGALREYRAIVSTDPAVPGHHVTVLAANIGEAMSKLEAQYGKGTIFGLHNEDDARRPRA